MDDETRATLVRELAAKAKAAAKATTLDDTGDAGWSVFADQLVGVVVEIVKQELLAEIAQRK
jgi:hypothetical protein